ncbi:hypothetical protein JCM3775_000050 [Rhodotorula graminis]
MSPKPRPAAQSGSWTPSPSPPASPAPLLDLSHADRLRLLEQHGPMRPSELGLPHGLVKPGAGPSQGSGGKGKEPMVVLDPEELERLVQEQQQSGTSVRDLLNGTASSDSVEGDADGELDLEPQLWEEVASAVLGTVPFAFLFAGMDYAVHSQFGESIVPREELRRLANFVPALLLLNFLSLRPPSRAPFPPLILQLLLLGLSVASGLSTIHTCTTQGYMRVMARAPATGVLWCWTVVRLDLGWAVAALAGVGVGMWLSGDTDWRLSIALVCQRRSRPLPQLSRKTPPSTMPSPTTSSLPAPLGNYAHLLPPSWKSIITAWLAEDTPSFDYGGFVVGETLEEATLWGKSQGVLAGVPFVDEIFAQLGCTVEWHLAEGAAVSPTPDTPKIKVATVKGPARCLLLGERVALNTMARCSGIAAKSRRVLVKARQLGWNGIIAGTRKTTPGFRLVEKYGMLVGGVDAHRYDLSSMVMLKDNHIWSKGSITQAVQAARSTAGFALRIHVECQSLAEAREAIAAGADIVMLDNFTPDGIRDAARALKEDWVRETGEAGREGGVVKRCLIEVSGGLTEENMEESLCPDVDILSTSSIHQGCGIVDFSLKIQQKASA